MSAATHTGEDGERDLRTAGPGHLLKAARESAGMSVRDVSAQLRLDERTIAALESDDFTGLPVPTFVRGYLRGYARLLGVPVGPVMEAYDREGFAPPDLVADIAEKPQAAASDFPVRLTSVVVVGVLVMLVVLWWNNQSFDEPGLGPAPSAASDPRLATDGAAGPTAPRQGESAPARLAPEPESRPQPEVADAGGSETSPPPGAAATQPAPADTPATAAGASTAGPGSAGPAASAERPAAGAPAGADVDQVIARAQDVLERTRTELDGLSQAQPAATAASDAAPAAPAAGTPTPDAPAVAGAAQETPMPGPTPAPAPAGGQAADGGEARLVIDFPVEAWVEVYDADEQRLFYNLVQPGRVLELSGKPPIRVLLGRTRGVNVRFNGEAVDLAPLTERGVARFTLGR